MVSRSPTGRSAAATQMRWSPWRRKSWALSPVWSRSAREHRAGGREQPVLAGGRGELAEPGAEHEAALHVAGHQAVVLERDGEPVRRRAGQPRGGHELGEGGGPGLESTENDGGLVQDADSARVVHASILPSHVMRCKFLGAPAASPSPRGDTRKGARHGPHAWPRRSGTRTSCDVRRGRAGPALHRPPPGARGDQPAGLRRAAARGPAGAAARPHHRDRGPQRPDAARPADRRPGVAHAGRDAAPQLRGVRRARCTRWATPSRASCTSSGPQLGLTQPGMTIVCGDSHTSTHGAFGALAFGIGTSEVEHVLATQTLPLKPFRTMAITVDGALPDGVTAKDLILAVIAQIGTGGGQGYVIEYRGEAIRAAVDGGADDGLQHVDRGRRPRRDDRARRDDVRLPAGPAARAAGRGLGRRGRRTGARCAPTTTRRSTREVVIDAADLAPFVTWGTNPGQGAAARRAGARPGARSATTTTGRRPSGRLEYMGLTAARRCATSPSTRSSSARAPTAGSRTCAPRPQVLQGRKVADGVRMLVVPGSARVRLQAESRGPGPGLHRGRRRVAASPAARCAWG